MIYSKFDNSWKSAISLLENKYGIHDTALLWYQNYLRDCQFKVTVDGSFSSEKFMNF